MPAAFHQACSAGAMDGAAMRAAERYGEFVACFAAERPWLQIAKMMRIGLFGPTDETCLLSNTPSKSDSGSYCQSRSDPGLSSLGLPRLRGPR